MDSRFKLTVGAANDADIVVQQLTVSKLHCELTWTGTAWSIRDLDSTNGTFVDGNRVKAPVELQKDSVVTLGRGVPFVIPPPPISKAPVLVAKAPVLAYATSHPSTSKLDTQRSKKRGPSVANWVTLGSGILTLFLALTSIYVLSNRTRDKGSDPVVVSQGIPDANRPAEKSTSEPQPGKSIQAPEPKDTSSPFWGVALRSKDGLSQRLLGTAVAVDSNHVFTLASILDAAKQVQEEFPQIVLVPLSESRAVRVASGTRIHPKYLEGLEKLRVFESDLDAKLEGIESEAEPSVEESLAWSNRLEEIMAGIGQYDQACIEVSQPLPSLLPIASQMRSESSNVILRGFPMILPSPYLEDDLATYFVDARAILKKDARNSRPLFQLETNLFPGLSLVSMACIDDSANLLGLCTRMSPDQGVGSKQRCLMVPAEAFWK